MVWMVAATKPTMMLDPNSSWNVLEVNILIGHLSIKKCCALQVVHAVTIDNYAVNCLTGDYFG